MKRLSLILLALPLAACSPTPSCPEFAVKSWTREEQTRAADELAKLPDDSILVPMLLDYAKLRREVE